MSNPAPTNPLPATLPDAVTAKIVAASKSLPPAFQAIAVAYAPAVIRIVNDNANADINALYAKLTGASAPAALDTIHAAMTLDELATEKELLATMTAKMAQDSYDARQIGQQVLKAALTAGISLALTAAGF